MEVAYSDNRYERFHEEDGKVDQRHPSQRDRDRILYTSAFRRLAGVTQVVNPHEGYIFHNRLTHTLEVAQIARRLAEKLLAEDSRLAAKLGGLDPDIAEAAAMAHDLGHPPFGHIGEQELDRLGQMYNNVEGFESNAQSFRIITRLEAQRAIYPGLNLTRATLNGVLKYPRFRTHETQGTDVYKKFGVYRTEEEGFSFAREGYDKASNIRSLEAAVMDYADDVAYSVHDLDDFYRAGLVPIDSLVHNKNEFEGFFYRWANIRDISDIELEHSKKAFRNLLDLMHMDEQFSGTVHQQSLLRTIASNLIKDFVFAVSLQRNAEDSYPLDIDREKRNQIKFLKGLVWVYVIRNPKLAVQQHGQRTVIRSLFERYLQAVRSRDEDLIPSRFHGELERIGRAKNTKQPHPNETRLAIDIVASFTDDQAFTVYRRMIGVTSRAIEELLGFF
jgi:dGTPase